MHALKWSYLKTVAERPISTFFVCAPYHPDNKQCYRSLQSISGNDPVKLAEWFRSSGLHQTVFGNVLFSEEQRNIGRSPLGLQQQVRKTFAVLLENTET